MVYCIIEKYRKSEVKIYGWQKHCPRELIYRSAYNSSSRLRENALVQEGEKPAGSSCTPGEHTDASAV